MTHEDSSLQQLERELRALAVAQPEDEDLRHRLRAQLRPATPAVRQRKLSLRFAVPAVGGLAAATAVVAFALIGNSGSGGPSAADAAILHRTLAAVTGPPATILHVKTVDTTDGTTFVGEWWQQTRAPFASRGIKGPIGHPGEIADTGKTSYLYDASTNTIYEHPDSSTPTFTDPISLTRQELANGQATVTGTATINGQSLYGIRLSTGITTYVAKGSYVPRYIDDPQAGGSTLRFTVETYQYLPTTPQNLRLLSITAQHPNAIIDPNPSDWPASASK